MTRVGLSISLTFSLVSRSRAMDPLGREGVRTPVSGSSMTSKPSKPLTVTPLSPVSSLGRA